MALPTPTPVTKPASVTVATVASLESNDAVTCEPSSAFPTKEIVKNSLSLIVFDVGLMLKTLPEVGSAPPSPETVTTQSA